MTKKVTVQIPATSANLGPGFDVLGMALQHYNEVTFETESHTWLSHKAHFPLSIEVEGQGQANLSRNESNLVFRAAMKVFDKAKQWPKSLQIRLLNRIPLSRGLGSSAAATVGGLCAANALLGKPLSDQEILDQAVRMEGHPDNVVPALVGGFCISGMIQNQPRYLKFRAPSDLQAVICVPDRPLPTSQARRVLPSRVPFTAAVFTSSRVAFLVGAVIQKHYDLLSFAMDDVLHQPQRAHLVPGLKEVIKAAKKAGAWGAALSGAGSSVMALVKPGPTVKRVSQAMIQAFKARHQGSWSLELSLDNRGIRYR